MITSRRSTVKTYERYTVASLLPFTTSKRLDGSTLRRMNVIQCARVHVATIPNPEVNQGKERADAVKAGKYHAPHTLTPLSTFAKGPMDPARAAFTTRNHSQHGFTNLQNALHRRNDSLSALTPPNGAVKDGQEISSVATILPTNSSRGVGGNFEAGSRND